MAYETSTCIWSVTGMPASWYRHESDSSSVDLWWLATALFLLCIIERDRIIDKTNFDYVDVFSIRKSSSFFKSLSYPVADLKDAVFELVSAYGTVGLTLGVSNVSRLL